MRTMEWSINRLRAGEVKMKIGQKKKVRLFEHPQVQYMITAAFPQVICRFQKPMHGPSSSDVETSRTAGATSLSILDGHILELGCS